MSRMSAHAMMQESGTPADSQLAEATGQSHTTSDIEESNPDTRKSQLMPAANRISVVHRKVSEVRIQTPPPQEVRASPDVRASSNTKRPPVKKSDEIISEERNVSILPLSNNPLYNVNLVADRLDEYPMMKIRREGKYYLSMKNVVIEKHPRVRRNRRGQVIPTINKEVLGPIESVFSRFCETVLCMSRAKILPLSSQGERHLIWVGRIKAKHIIKFLKGNGCYIVNRFPGDVFLKDKQVMGVTLRQYMLERKNQCFWRCGAPKDDLVDDDDDESNSREVTYRICPHMVLSMRTDEGGCTNEECYNFGKPVCRHFDVFIPEVQSFCLYNALQDFSNRLDADLKGQLFICKPAYLYKGLGFRFFHRGAEFEEFYHMSIGKETSRHDFLVQRVVKDPYLFNGRKVDIRAFLLIVTLRHRRVVAFVNPGFCRLASTEYKPFLGGSEEEEESDEPPTPRQLREKREKQLRANMQMLVCPHLTEEERADRAKRMAENRQFTDLEDRSKELDEVFRSDSLLARIKRQIRHIGMRLASGIERRIWDAYGCYQIFGLDLCVDESYKVWLLEVNSHAMSEVDMLSPTQRVVVPAVIMEALGLVVECMYKSSNGLRLRKSPLDEFKETGFLFGQNYQMVFSTLTRRRTNYVHPRPHNDNGPPFYQRIATVDEMMRKTARRKLACENMKLRMHEEKVNLKKRQSEKKEEES